MKNKKNSFSYFLFTILAAVLLCSCGPRKPADTDIQRFLQGQLPSYLQITKIETKSFPGPVSGTGRTSATVALVLTEPLYRAATQQEIQAELNRHGLTSDDVSKYAPYTGFWSWPLTYITFYPKGTQFTSAADVGYQEEANGWTFDGGVNTSGIQGQPFSSLPTQGTSLAGAALVLGSSEAETYLKEFLDRKNIFTEKKEKFTSWLKAYFAKGQRHDGKVTEFGAPMDETHTHSFTLTLTDELASTNEGFDVHGIVDWHNWNPKNNYFFSNCTSGAQESVHLVGRINISGAGNGQFDGFIDMLHNGQNGLETYFARRPDRQIEMGFCTLIDRGIKLELGPSTYQPPLQEVAPASSDTTPSTIPPLANATQSNMLGKSLNVSNGMEMVWVEPIHGWVGKYLVTQKEYQDIMGNNTSKFIGARRPVEQVTWYEATDFCEGKYPLTPRMRGERLVGFGS